MSKQIQIEQSWKDALADFFESAEWKTLADFVKSEYQHKKVYPNGKDIFKAFNLTPIDKVKVVILGQDPYHGEGQAEGLSFSVPKGVNLPPSLQNIYKEIESDMGIKKDFTNGSLEAWATQGVFLLNAMLTVIANSPASHQGKGWEVFTDKVIETISLKTKHTVFILWGNFARSKKVLIDTSKHLVLESTHPSPFSAYNGFFGSKPFSQTNQYLKSHHKKEIEW